MNNAVIAVVHAVALYIQFHHLEIFNTTLQTSIFFLPAVVRVIAVIVCGYSAGIGIALGVILHDSLFNVVGFKTVEMLVIAAEQGFVAASSLFVWSLLSRKITGLRSPVIDYLSLDLFDIFKMCVIQAFINASVGHVFFANLPTIHRSFDIYYFTVMVVGDITGAFFLFLFANIMFSILFRSGLLPRRKPDWAE